VGGNPLFGLSRDFFKSSEFQIEFSGILCILTLCPGSETSRQRVWNLPASNPAHVSDGGGAYFSGKSLW